MGVRDLMAGNVSESEPVFGVNGFTETRHLWQVHRDETAWTGGGEWPIHERIREQSSWWSTDLSEAFVKDQLQYKAEST